MKKLLTGFIAALTSIVLVAYAHAAGPPVVLTHALTGYSKGATEVTLEYTLQVQNQEDAALTGLSLSLVPRPPIVMARTTVTVPDLAPKGTAETKVRFITRLLRDEKYFSQRPLLFAGKCFDANGKLVEFPVKSRPGGAP